VHKILNKIREHETYRENNKNPVEESKKLKNGKNYDNYDADDNNNNNNNNSNFEDVDDDDDDFENEKNNEKDVDEIFKKQRLLMDRIEQQQNDEKQNNHNNNNNNNEEDDIAMVVDDDNFGVEKIEKKRITLLYSATAVQQIENKKTLKKNKKIKLNGTLQGVSQNFCLPEHLKQFFKFF
jgi:hypothetical protein